MNNYSKYLDQEHIGKLFLRLAVGGLMIFHGIAKILAPESLGYIQHLLSEVGLPSFIAYGVFVGEFIAPLLIILGLFSRVGGVLIAGNMLFVLVLAHTADMFSFNQFGGWAIELQIFFLLAALAITFMGSGKYAIKAD